jgi:hypothetical protein
VTPGIIVHFARLKNVLVSRVLVLTSVIQATQEAEIRRMTV